MQFFLYKDKAYSPGRRHRLVSKLLSKISVNSYNSISKKKIENRFSFNLPGKLTSLLKIRTSSQYLGIYNIYKGMQVLTMGISNDISTSYSSDKKRLKLKEIPIGQVISSIEIQVGKGPVLSRAAGTYAKIVGILSKKNVLVRLSSGKLRSISSDCYANLGASINDQHSKNILGKAGCNIWRNKKPHTRGIAKNPVDHAHGGRTNGGVGSKTPNGKITKGPKTISKKVAFLQKKYIY